jgi:hypothetical protein
MRIFKHKYFWQWAKNEKISDHKLIKAINEIEAGLYEANLGSGLYKKRIAMAGKGKSGGYRTLIALKHNDKAFLSTDLLKMNMTILMQMKKRSISNFQKTY